jgi:putative spermidine/putrescine transport system permease protein
MSSPDTIVEAPPSRLLTTAQESRTRQLLPRMLPAIPAMVWVTLFMLGPVIALGIYSLWKYESFDVLPVWNLNNYRALFEDATYLRILLRSLMMTVATVVAGIILAYPFAYWLSRRVQGIWKQVFLILIVAPFWTGFLVRTYAMISVVSDGGLINTALQSLGIINDPLNIMYTRYAVVIAAVYLTFAYGVVSIFSSLENMGYELHDAAMTLGATPWQTFRRVTLPLSRAGIQSATLFIFFPTLGLYVTPQLLGGPNSTMIGQVIVAFFKQALDIPLGAAVTFLLVAVCFLFLLALLKAANVEELYAGGLTGFGGGGRRATAEDKKKFSPLGLYAVLIYVFLYLPIFLLILFSFNDSPSATFPLQGFTLKWYRQALGTPFLRTAIKNSLLIASGTCLLSMLITVPGAYAVVRHRFPGRDVLRYLILIPLILPDLMLGVGLFVLFTYFNVRFSVWTILIGHVTRALPFVYLIIYAQQQGFRKSLEEASWNLGATPLATFRRVTFPLMLPGIIGGALFAFTISLDEFIITFLVSSHTQTIPLYVWGMLRTMVAPDVNAIGSLLIGVALLLVFTLQFYRLRRETTG